MSITTRPLTATEVDKAKPKEKPYRLLNPTTINQPYTLQ